MPKLHSSSEAESAGQSEATRESDGTQRMLKIAIGIMTALIVLGLLAVIARIVYLAGNKATRAPAAVAGGAAAGATQLALPAGVSVRSISLAGDRLAVHYEGPNGAKAGITILDAVTGETVRRIEIVPAVP